MRFQTVSTLLPGPSRPNFHFVPILCLRPAPESQPQCDLHPGLAAEGRFEGRERGKIYCMTVSASPPPSSRCLVSAALSSPRQSERVRESERDL